jgi:hypothetical protein
VDDPVGLFLVQPGEGGAGFTGLAHDLVGVLGKLVHGGSKRRFRGSFGQGPGGAEAITNPLWTPLRAPT